MPVLTLSEIKAQLRLESSETAEDALLSQINEAAQDYAEQYLGRLIPWTDDAGAEVTVPASVRSAILLMAHDLYENRGDLVIGASVNRTGTIENLLHFYRVGLGV